MARIRTIKPDFFKNEDLAELPAMARLLFIGLFTLGDKRGRLEDRPKRIKAELFPYENIDIEKYLEQLFEKKFIIRYSVFFENENLNLIQITNFEKHQRITGKESLTESAYPEYVMEEGNTGETTGKHWGNTGETTGITGKEGKGREEERKGKEKRNQNFSFDFGFVKKDFENCFFDFVKHRESIGKPFRTQDSIELFYKKLLKISENDPLEAMEIVENSIVNGWQGIFEKEKKYSGEKKEAGNPRKQSVLGHNISEFEKWKEKNGITE